jgi:hypothetical protein
MDLREWTILYIRHKDLYARKLQGHREEQGKLIFTFKDHALHAHAMEELRLPEQLEGKTLLVTLNTEANIAYLISHWKEFSGHAHLTIVFVNPALNEKWFIIPHTHAQIADPNISSGIHSLAENVPLVG